MRVFVTGGTGLIGVRLVRRLRGRGDEVVVLSRRPDAWQCVGPDCRVVVGDPTEPGPWQDELAVCDAAVNLAGENLFARRWDEAFKAQLRDSRLRATENVAAALAKQPARADGAPKVLVNGSAVGYYGPHGDEELTEDSPPGDDFMARLCADWEAAALAVGEPGASAPGAAPRVAVVRTGVVLDPAGGALAQLLTPFKLGLGGPVGSGRQYLPWIHHADIVGIFLLALDHPEARGPLNGTAPHPVTNKQFAKALGAALGRPAFLPTPALGLRLLLGEVAGVITTGQRVLPKRPLELGYQFRYPEVGPALRQLVGRTPAAV